MDVPYVDLARQHAALAEPIREAVERVLASGHYVGGPEVECFEAGFADFCGVRFAIGVGNGTDAISLVLRALGIGAGAEVITAPNSFLASASAIALAGATPRFADVADDGNLDPAAVEAAVTPRSRAILAVHLTGRPADMDALAAIAQRHGLELLEDAAQAAGARWRGRRVGSLGRAGCFSLHPLKTLAACGDAGVITTDDETLAAELGRLRNHGLVDRDTCERWAPNSRLDPIQAAILNVKLPHVDAWNETRRQHARVYAEACADLADPVPPRDTPPRESVFHTFVVTSERRDALRAWLAEAGVDTRIHYPVPIHLQPAARDLGYARGAFPRCEALAGRILSLPVAHDMPVEEREQVIEALRSFDAKAPSA